jgi:hypothetical protein
MNESLTGIRHHRSTPLTSSNNGWAQQEIRDFLSYHSDTMASTYARIADDTLARKTRILRAIT